MDGGRHGALSWSVNFHEGSTRVRVVVSLPRSIHAQVLPISVLSCGAEPGPPPDESPPPKSHRRIAYWW